MGPNTAQPPSSAASKTRTGVTMRAGASDMTAALTPRAAGCSGKSTARCSAARRELTPGELRLGRDRQAPRGLGLGVLGPVGRDPRIGARVPQLDRTREIAFVVLELRQR